jgi:metal-sulfur cluster biosynthetic enzyme
MGNRRALIDSLRQIIDPEVGLDIVSLGLLYQVDITPESTRIVMTITTPACPMGEYLRSQVEESARAVVGPSVEVAIVHTPPWNAAMMDSHAKASMGWQ